MLERSLPEGAALSDLLPERPFLCPRFSRGLAAFCAHSALSFPGNREEREISVLGTNSRHFYSSTVALGYQQEILTEGRLSTRSQAGGINIVKMVQGKLKQSKSIHNVNHSLSVAEKQQCFL